MKLDYLQFLELEVFTRFGARLEASVEARIQRGRLLRELLRQERAGAAAGGVSAGLADRLQRGDAGRKESRRDPGGDEAAEKRRGGRQLYARRADAKSGGRWSPPALAADGGEDGRTA